MSTLRDFETILNEVVQAKRLSQSKMTKLTEIAMTLMDHDTQLVSTMYRTHKSLPSACKISSLYVFDALARAARQQVIKHNLSERHSTGNCATFLSKVAGVLEGLFQDMLTTGLPEAKDKTKKIYDIWVKGNTFPPDILSRLSDIVSGKDKEPEPNLPIETDPQTPSTVIPGPLSTDPQATLLALLTQAASNHIPPPTANAVSSPTTPLDPAQLAIFRYLQSASVNNTAKQITSVASTPVQDSHVSQTATDPRISKSSSPPDEPALTKQDERNDIYRSPPPMTRSHDRDYDNRGYSRNAYRGNLRRRGRWNRWDERDRDRDRDQNEVPTSPRRGGRSRSRSPGSRLHHRNSPALSPPRRPSYFSRARNDGDTPRKLTSHDTGKDEFGRDLRPSSPPPKSPTSSATSHVPNASPTIPPILHEPKADSSTSTSIDPMSRSSSIAANTSSKEPNTPVAPESSTGTLQKGLESFDISTFNPTSPASWEALGKMWQLTHGYLPSTEELMQFMMMGAMNQSVASGNWEQETVGANGMNKSPQSGEAFRGFYGKTRNGHHGWANNHDETNDQSTDAVVLGGDSIDLDVSRQESDSPQHPTTASGRLGGKMQKIGDKWVFVRSDGTS